MGRTWLCRSHTRTSFQRRWTTSELFRRRRWLLVTWIEHVEVDARGVHNLYRPLVSSGLAFGAKRWVFTLDRQCERLATAMATTLSPDIATSAVINSIEGKRSILKLAERMVINFCGRVSASTAHTWTTLSGSGADDVRVMTRKSIDDPGRPPGIVLSAATSFWLPVPPKRVFDFLRDEQSRNEVIVGGGGGGGGAFIGGGAATTAAPAGGAPAAEAPPVEEKKEEREESDDDMGFSLFD